MKKESVPFFHRLWRDQRGISFIYAAIMLPLFMGFAALTFDVGYGLFVRNKLVGATAAAALAAAQYVSETCSGCSPASDASAAATKYFNANWPTSLTALAPTLTVTPKCLVNLTNQAPLSNLGAACSSSATTGVPLYNAVSVRANVTAPTFFAQNFGFKSLPLLAISYAAAKGSLPPPMNVMFIVDSTASMSQTDSTCSATKIMCALEGVQQVLKQLWPNRDQVGLMTFPGLTSATYVAAEYGCSGSTSVANGISAYYAGWGGTSAPLYQIIGSSTTGSTDYRTQSGSNAPSSGLNTSTSSNMLNAVGAGHGCATKGLQTPGGEGTFYADIITAAQATLTAWNAELVASGGTARQNVIIFLSDGDANANDASPHSSSNICCSVKPTTGQSVKINFQCHEAVAAAQAAAAAPVAPNTTSTWVYSVAYGAETSGSCTTDNAPTKVPPATSPPAAEPYQACQTMTNIASDPTKFYSDDANGCASTAHPSITSLSAIFADVAASLNAGARLIDGTIFGGATQ